MVNTWDNHGWSLGVASSSSSSSSYHGNAAVGDLALAPAAYIADGGSSREAQGVPRAVEGATPAGQSQQV